MRLWVAWVCWVCAVCMQVCNSSMLSCMHCRVCHWDVHVLVRTGSSNTLFFSFVFFFFIICFRGHLPETPGFRSAKQIFVANFRYTTWARILSDRNIFCSLRGRRTTAGSNAPFLVVLRGTLSMMHSEFPRTFLRPGSSI